MFFAAARGVPEAGLAFAAAMVLGVGLTLVGTAVMTVGARSAIIILVARHGASAERLAR
jgi:nickel/cobalt exporter